MKPKLFVIGGLLLLAAAGAVVMILMSGNGKAAPKVASKPAVAVAPPPMTGQGKQLTPPAPPPMIAPMPSEQSLGVDPFANGPKGTYRRAYNPPPPIGGGDKPSNPGSGPNPTPGVQMPTYQVEVYDLPPSIILPASMMAPAAEEAPADGAANVQGAVPSSVSPQVRAMAGESSQVAGVASSWDQFSARVFSNNGQPQVQFVSTDGGEITLGIGSVWGNYWVKTIDRDGVTLVDSPTGREVRLRVSTGASGYAG